MDAAMMQSALFLAVESGAQGRDSLACIHFVFLYFSINVREKEYLRCLHLCSVDGWALSATFTMALCVTGAGEELVEALLARGARLDAVDSKGTTLLEAAAKNGENGSSQLFASQCVWGDGVDIGYHVIHAQFWLAAAHCGISSDPTLLTVVIINLTLHGLIALACCGVVQAATGCWCC